MEEYKNEVLSILHQQVCNELAREFTADSEAFAKHMELLEDINHLTINIFILAASFAAEDIKYAYKRNMISTQFRRYFNRFVGEIGIDGTIGDKVVIDVGEKLHKCKNTSKIAKIKYTDSETLTETEQPVIDYITRASFMLRNTIAFDL